MRVNFIYFCCGNHGLQIREIGIRCSALFDINRDTTLGHELFHGLGLYHTHIEKTTLANGTIYNYHYDTLSTAFNKMKVTDNTMSYNSDKKITWQWQKKIIYRYLSE